jgi:hypothetical protein
MAALPLLAIAIIIYNLVVFGGSIFGVQDIHALLNQDLLTISVISGEQWHFTGSDFFILLALALLFIEIIKSTKTTARQLVNHALSMIVFIVAILEFLALKGFATSAFFFIMAMTLVDVIGGYTISVVAAEHDLGLGKAGTDE